MLWALLQVGDCLPGKARTGSDNERVIALSVVPSVETIASRLAPLRRQIAAHPLYARIRTLQDVRIFMESHVFAVWDFMSLLKALQRTLTCVDVPWTPTRFPASRRFVNEIVLGEESDLYSGRPISHFEIYLEAMQQVGADTRPIHELLSSASRGCGELNFASAPWAAKEFVTNTFRFIEQGSPAALAAVFTFGREDAIPDMFRSLVRQINQERNGQLDQFVWYLERHIEVDGEDHGPLALNMIADLCGADAEQWQQAANWLLRRRCVRGSSFGMGFCRAIEEGR